MNWAVRLVLISIGVSLSVFGIRNIYMTETFDSLVALEFLLAVVSFALPLVSNKKSVQKSSNQKRPFVNFARVIIVIALSIVFFLVLCTFSKFFNPDYHPGKENVFGNLSYFNNGGFVCEQDKKYYLTVNGILRKTSDFKEYYTLYKGIKISYINVIKDWVYFIDNGDIVKVRVDGKKEEVLLSAKEGEWITCLFVYDDQFYYIKNDILYYSHITELENGGKKLSEDIVLNFVLDEGGANILYVSAIKSDEYTYRPDALKHLSSGDDTTTVLLKYQPVDSQGNGGFVDIPTDLCRYEDNNYFITNQLYEVDFLLNINKISVSSYDHTGFTGLCVINDYAYYTSVHEHEYGTIYRYSFTNQKIEKLGQPFEEKQQFLIYPIGNRILVLSGMNSNLTWYLWDYQNNTLEKLNI